MMDRKKLFKHLSVTITVIGVITTVVFGINQWKNSDSNTSSQTNNIVISNSDGGKSIQENSTEQSENNATIQNSKSALNNQKNK